MPFLVSDIPLAKDGAKTSKSGWRIVEAKHHEKDFFPNLTGEFDEGSPFAKAPFARGSPRPTRGAGVSTQPPRAATKRSRTSAADHMATPAEQLWSGKTRDLLDFERIAPTQGLPMGAVGVAPGSMGDAAFFSYLKQHKVIARLESEGFEPGPPHAWYLRLAPGVVTPGEKALCRALTGEQRARIEANRLAALERRRRLCDVRGEVEGCDLCGGEE